LHIFDFIIDFWQPPFRETIALAFCIGASISKSDNEDENSVEPDAEA
jgi:hypothetical protein